MLQQVEIDHILFIDIETVPQYPSYNELPDNYKSLWDKKASHLRKDEQTPEELYSRAGIYAEFGKIICISAGIIFQEKDENKIKLKSYYGDDEKAILTDFAGMLENYSAEKEIFLCAHNGKEFDYPFLARRMLIHGIKLPDLLDLAGRKPWEVKHLDTMELWKFGDYKHYTSLELLTAIFHIPSPKDDIDGSQVAKVYWQDNDIDRIVVYCQNDVLAVAQLVLRYKGMEILKEEQVEIANT